ncbi:hypothetical protein CK203_019656 [Vitis vinifera]|uniref:Uncharacterized protein n=1 Tax=Vitis vinifera TaxID=29760 RepID=A0A438JQS7_VITVI|nr:hypothetical protein CK203_019656 [Vitis vinifera]
MDGMQNDLSQKIDNLQYSILRLTNLNIVQEKGRFPSQPHQNPKVSMKWRLMRENLHSVEASEGQHPIARHDQTSVDLCKIPEGLVHYQKRLNVNKKAFLTEQVSAIIQCKSPVKYKDPGCPTISVMIGGKLVEKALLDLGASVNLLPYSVYKQLGLGELKPTSITLSLADRSVKIPRGMIEDVLVQVDNFYYPMDFVVLDTDPIEWTHATHIWQHDIGAQYLLYVQEANQSEEEEGPEEVCIIDTLVEEHCNQKIQEELNESLGDLDEGLPEPSDLLATLPPWRRIEEILPLFNEERHKKLLKRRPQSLFWSHYPRS